MKKASISEESFVKWFYHKSLQRKEILTMAKYTTILNFLSSHISRYEFKKVVNIYNGDKGTRTLSTENLFKVMLYAQITKAFSLHEIIKTLNANGSKLYHSGMSPSKKSTVADALQKRDYRIFEDVFTVLLKKSQTLFSGKRRFRHPLRIIDASTVDLCLSRFNWAHFRKAKGALKLHASYDPDTMLPHELFLSTGKVHESTTLCRFSKNPNDILVFDRGYNCYNSFWNINLDGSVFVTRVKSNTIIQKHVVLESACSENVLEDCLCTFSSKKGKSEYPGTIRIIAYRDPETEKVYRFLTNDVTRSAQDIADIYKERWQIELFFKWIKQNLKIKTFFGTSRNAVWSQIWIAMILYLLMWIVKHLYAIQESMQRILQVLKTTLFDRCHIESLFKPPPPHKAIESFSLFGGHL
jgi:hypothetical protein